jgi:DNA-directed RNA polymerase subunit RPC12/RpoP
MNNTPPNAERPLAHLTVVYVYDCDECGRENLVRPIRPDLSPEDEQETRAALGIEPWEEGEICQMPDEVQCQFCGAKYRVHDVRDEEDE